VQASLQTSDARFLTRADPPQSPDTASRRRIVLMAALGGMVAGAGLAMLLERLTDTFRSPADLAARTGLPVLAAVPQSGSLRRPRDLLRKYLGKPNGALAEAVRNLRTSILFSDPADPPKVVMFTSSVPGEGKSTTAMLVAVTSQQMGRSAIVVDCDFRRRTLSHILSPESDRPGLVALLEGRLGIDEAVMVEPESGVHLLAQGPTEREDGSPADVLASPRFAALINDLRSRYDLIVLDTPPVLVVTDSRVLARLADAVVYLVRWDRTGRNAVQEGLRELASIKARFAGVVFTLVNEARAAKHVDNEYYYKRRYKHYIAG
jgi:capsular exopolysaccharide synthesis family protein